MLILLNDLFGMNTGGFKICIDDVYKNAELIIRNVDKIINFYERTLNKSINNILEVMSSDITLYKNTNINDYILVKYSNRSNYCSNRIFVINTDINDPNLYIKNEEYLYTLKSFIFNLVDNTIKLITDQLECIIYKKPDIKRLQKIIKSITKTEMTNMENYDIVKKISIKKYKILFNEIHKMISLCEDPEKYKENINFINNCMTFLGVLNYSVKYIEFTGAKHSSYENDRNLKTAIFVEDTKKNEIVSYDTSLNKTQFNDKTIIYEYLKKNNGFLYQSPQQIINIIDGKEEIKL